MEKTTQLVREIFYDVRRILEIEVSPEIVSRCENMIRNITLLAEKLQISIQDKPMSGSQPAPVSPSPLMTDPQRPALNPGRTQRPGRQYTHILLAEDSYVTRTLAHNMIEQQGWRVTAVKTGREALDALERENFDLIIMDIQMPDLNGLEATRMIRQLEKQATRRRTPIVALTGLDSLEYKEFCLQSGMDSFVNKDTHLDELLRVIEQLLTAG